MDSRLRRYETAHRRWAHPNLRRGRHAPGRPRLDRRTDVRGLGAAQANHQLSHSGPEKRRKFDREFREGAVRLVNETGKSIAAAARELGIKRAPWATGSCWTGRPRRAPRACPPGTSPSPSGCARRTPSCGWSAMSSLDEYGDAGHVDLFVGNGEGRPRCLVTGWPV
ncbi:hypothetical protein DN585_14200 [Intrasporangium calvum]|nr:hypothetical protein DN585_14200 [Intrasporangium calvum]